jgi:Xaa-Pro aminopeptidase
MRSNTYRRKPKSSGKKLKPRGGGRAPGRGPAREIDIPSSVFGERLGRLRNAAGGHGADHVLVTNFRDVGYLTGFLGGDSYLVIPVAPGTRPTIISDFRYLEELEPYKKIADIFIRKRSMDEAVIEYLSDTSVWRCAIQGENATVSARDAWAKGAGESKLVTTKGLVTRLRAIKDEHEIAIIERAIRIQERALVDVVPTIKPGQTEAEVAAALEARMRALGASGVGFSSIVAAGAKSSLPHYRAGAVKIARNQTLLIDWGAVCQGYTGDMTRTLTIGKWPAKIREIYQIVLEAHTAAAEALGPGRTTVEIDAVAREHIRRQGYEEFFGHGLGHGIGIDIHEEPRLSHVLPPSSLEPGMVTTIEPGIYLPGVGGVRLENDYLITPTGSRNLCSLPMDLEWATLAV